MANFPGGAGAIPGVYTNVETQSTGSSVPGGVLVPVLIGEGSKNEVLIPSAVGGGKDGLDPTFTTSNGADGRHFELSLAPIISNRTQLFKNGVLLIGLEDTIDTNPFSDSYDYRVDITTGHIELQTAHIVNQGGSFYTTAATNVGVGTLQNLMLVDVNAPPETWSIKCVGVQRNNLNQPVADTAQFVAFGSVSGNVLDANGNPVVWISDGYTATNTILSFSINETTPFVPGDYFTVQVYSGVLNRNDSLTATYIPVANINDPAYFTNMNQVTTKHGPVSLDNRLSLGSQLAFANDPPGIMCLQAAPSLPRRTSYELETRFNALSTDVDDFVIPFAVGVQPDTNSNIHIFATNTTTGVETQLLANKFEFYTLGNVGQPTISAFVFDNAAAPAGNSFAYSVVQEVETINFAQDGYLNRFFGNSINAFFSSATAGALDATYVGKNVKIIDSNNLANIGTFPIVAVSGGVAQIRASSTPPFSDFVNGTGVTFELIDPIFGTVVASSQGTDGQLVATANTATGTFHSTTVTFSGFNPVVDGLKLRVTASGTASNIGLFDITALNTGTNTLTIAKSFVSESSLKFEIQDPTSQSFYLVLNHNIVPNGNNLRVTIVDERDASFFDAGWETALATLETQSVNIVVPLPNQTISVIFENTVQHCITMSNILNKEERVAFIGAINGLTPDNLTGASNAAVEDIGVLEGIQGNTVAEVLAGNTEDLTNYSVPNAFGDTFRCVYFYPDQIVVAVGSDNQIIDGFYLAAAGAGYVAGQANVAVPITNKVLSGFSILKNRQFSPTVYQNLAAAGVTALQPVAGGGLVVWGLTTTQSGAPEEQEISIVFIRDTIAAEFRSALSGFVGQPGYPNVITNMSARALGMLRAFIGQGLITNYANLAITQDSVDPRQYNIVCQVQPTYSVNWIYVTTGVGVINS